MDPQILAAPTMARLNRSDVLEEIPESRFLLGVPKTVPKPV